MRAQHAFTPDKPFFMYYWTLARILSKRWVSSCLLGASWRREDVGCPR